MSNITTTRDEQVSDGHVLLMPMAAVKLYAGTLLCVNTAGYVTNAADTASFVFAGVALDTIDNSGGAAGALSIRVRVSGTIAVDSSGLTQASVGVKVYASDNHTALTSTTNSVLVGRIVEYDTATTCRVKMTSMAGA